MGALRYWFVLVSLLYVGSLVSAQVSDPVVAAQAPIAGAGHHYIGIGAETVNPVDGTLTFDLPIQTPPGRQLPFPFAIHYNTAEISTLSGLTITPAPDDVGGWNYGLPIYMATAGVSGSAPNPNCWGVPNCQLEYCLSSSNYVFSATQEGQHPLYMSNQWPSPNNNMNIGCSTGAFGIGTGGNGLGATFTGTTGSAQQPPLTVTSRSGTVYQFAQGPSISNTSSLTRWGMLAQTITDRNGNQIVRTGGGDAYVGGSLTIPTLQSGYYTDTLGRHVVSWSGIGNTSAGDQITVSGLSSNIVVKWANKTFNFRTSRTFFSGTDGPDCHFSPGTQSSTFPAVTEIDLPITSTGTPKYIFEYGGTWGRLQKIKFPNGGYVRYVWDIVPNANAAQTNWIDYYGNQRNCYYTFDTLAITDRYVSFDGVTEVLHQQFTYQPVTWLNSGAAGVPYWNTKQTTVKTTDQLTGQITYTKYVYGSVIQPVIVPGCSGGDCAGSITWPQIADQIPVETQVQNQDSSQTALKTVNKTWADQYGMIGEQTVLDNGQATTVLHCLDSSERVLGSYEYGFQSEGAKPTDPACSILPQAPAAPQGSTLSYGLNTAAIGPLRRQTITAYHMFSGSSNLDSPDSLTVKDGSGTQIKQTTFAYDGSAVVPSGAQTGLVAAPGPRGNPSSISRWLNTTGTSLTTSYTYYDTGQVASMIDACGSTACTDVTGTNHTTTYSYTDNFTAAGAAPGQTFGYLTQVTHPNTGVAHTEKFSWGYNDGLIRSRKDVENNLTTTYDYSDPLLRLKQIINPDGGQTNIAYNDVLYSPTITTTKQINSSQSVVSVAKMDGMGRTVQTQLTSDPQGTVYADTTFDGLGRVWKQSNPYRSGTDATTTTGTTVVAYDSLGRKSTETAPDNSVITTSYCGPYTLVKDPTNRWRRSRTDGLGFLVEVDEPNSNSATVNVCPGTGEPIWVTSYGYDVLGNLASVVQNGSHNRSFTYDSLSRLLTSANPEVGTITYTYDANSNIFTKKDARNITITYGYDVLNREKSRTYSNGDPSVSINYDETNCLGLSPCQNIGHRTSMSDAAGSEAWSYKVNSGSSVHVDQRTTISSSGNYTKTSTYYLDLARNITQMVYPSGRTVNYSYDNANRPKSATDAVNGLTYATGLQTPPVNSACVASAVCYTPQGTPYAMSVGQSSTFTGLNITESFNNRLQPNQIKASSAGGNAMDITYSYKDPNVSGSANAGHVFSVTNNLDSARSQTFGYDQLNRITAAHASTYSVSPTKCWGETYSLDPWTNLNSITPDPAFNGCSQEAGFSQTANTSNRLSGFQYDAAGNTTNDGVRGYQWNGESQLTWLYNVTYTYDGAGRRVTKSGGSEPKLYWYGSGGEILSETSPAALEIVDYVYFGGKRVAQLANDFNLNGGFEAGLTNWSSSGSGAATAITNAASAHSGSNYVQLTAPAGYTSTKLTTTVPISAQQGETITMTGWVYRETNNSIQLSRWWMLVNGSNGGVGGHPVDNFTVGSWIQQTVSATVPTWLTGPYTVTVWAEVDSDSSSVSARFDDATLNGNTLLFAEDSLGTTRVITDTSGVVCYDADFYPYGGERPYTNTCTTHYKFEGKERDAESGNDYFGARFYTNRFGRWLSSDWSAKPVAVPYANLTNPQTLNLYSIVADDPESFADLDGHYICKGGPENCHLVRDALANLQEAIKSGNLTKNEAAALQKVVDFYGAAGKDNGVTVKFVESGGHTGTKDGRTTVSVALKGILANDVFKQNGASPYTEIAARVAHEGEHGVQQRAHGMPTVKAEEKAVEVQAYTVQSFVNKGLWDTSAYMSPRAGAPIWSTTGGFNAAAVDEYAEASTAKWCQNGGNCQ